MTLRSQRALRVQRFLSHADCERPLGIAALACFPAFAFQPLLCVRAAQTIAFFVLCLFRRGRARLLPALTVSAGITFFSLLSPFGRVLWRAGSFTVTQGALENGLSRSLLLAGMVFLSQAALAPQSRFKTNGLIAETLQFLAKISAVPPRFEKGKMLERLDECLYAAYYGEPGTAESKAADSIHKPLSAGQRAICACIAAALPAAMYALLVFGFVIKT